MRRLPNSSLQRTVKKRHAFCLRKSRATFAGR
jgi:hypothetical protein